MYRSLCSAAIPCQAPGLSSVSVLLGCSSRRRNTGGFAGGTSVLVGCGVCAAALLVGVLKYSQDGCYCPGTTKNGN